MTSRLPITPIIEKFINRLLVRIVLAPRYTISQAPMFILYTHTVSKNIYNNYFSILFTKFPYFTNSPLVFNCDNFFIQEQDHTRATFNFLTTFNFISAQMALVFFLFLFCKFY